MAEYKDHAAIVIADVDCTAEGKSKCDEVGVRGFPTIKYGDPSDLQDYEGGRKYADLSKFAKENLGPQCGPSNLDLCDAVKKSAIETYMKLDAKDLAKQIKDKEDELAASDNDLE